MSMSVDYLIIGNSAAGLSAAETIRAHHPKARILMLSREPYPAYGRPLISYLIEGKTTEDEIWLKDSDFYETHALQTMFGPGYCATELIPEAHAVHLANNETITYGKCLLATGSVPFVPPIQGLDQAANTVGFMTLDDAKRARNLALHAAEVASCEGRQSVCVVIGAGLIGLKAAEALSHHVDKVIVLELAPRILPAVLDDAGAALLQEKLACHGIECMPGVSAQTILVDKDGVATEALLTDESQIDLDMIITAVGVRPNTQLAVDAGAKQGRGLIVDEMLRTTLPDVYAAGDVVQVRDILDGADRPLALWPNAMRQGVFAGKSMAKAKDAEPFIGSFAVNAVDFFDVSLLTAGIINPPQDAGYEQIDEATEDTYAKFVVRDGLLVGYILLNRPTNAGLYTAMIENRIPLDSLSEGIFDAAPQNLDFPYEQRWERLHNQYPGTLNELGWKESA